jgi:hypothetical protein
MAFFRFEEVIPGLFHKFETKRKEMNSKEASGQRKTG